MFSWLKESRIVKRFDKLATSFAAMVSLACAVRCLRQYSSYGAWSCWDKTRKLVAHLVLSINVLVGRIIFQSSTVVDSGFSIHAA